MQEAAMPFKEDSASFRTSEADVRQDDGESESAWNDLSA